MSGKIDISGMKKSEVLAKLYNASKPQGIGLMQYTPEDMSTEEAQGLLDQGQTYFDYLKGRIMKINLKTDLLNPWAYDRDNGQGACAKALGIGAGSGGHSALKLIIKDAEDKTKEAKANALKWLHAHEAVMDDALTA